MACASCAAKAAKRNQRLSSKFKNDPKRLARLIKEAERKGDLTKVELLKKKLNG
mgnify:CR=1 FL=1